MLTQEMFKELTELKRGLDNCVSMLRITAEDLHAVGLDRASNRISMRAGEVFSMGERLAKLTDEMVRASVHGAEAATRNMVNAALAVDSSL